ncbi:Invertase/pectin methylesterase inhibitor domain superfamily [Arabidopsis suecica]|uniref:Invertase/pectin methylesterase inhibitor domain superfamily n=1 Tax=Arabidopsis suecica TaxID=45249 RepID=A0A8T2B6E3_ARASU|nr:Invertase/pectin methylesterase inhibitor domain superfamily [Arabidopsis suecica]
MNKKMALLAKLLILTTLVTTISITSRANEELMMQQCHNSDNPTLCLRCLSSDPTSHEADKVGLARIILKCINSQLLILTKNASTFGSQHYRNPKAAAAWKQCGLGFSTAKRGLGEADAHLITGDYDKAANDVSVKVVNPPVSRHSTSKSLQVSVTIWMFTWR